MFNENTEQVKLDWLYKNPNTQINREEYLLGRSVDKALEDLNAEEKQKEFGATTSKNCVEHECIPPSIRDFNSVVQFEQVDLSSKLQEDPLMAIKQREEESRKQFLQNPIQLKKLQNALKVQEINRNVVKASRKHSKKSYFKLKGKELDIILMYKFNQLKSHLTEDDFREIMVGKSTSSKTIKKKKRKKRSTSKSSDDKKKPIVSKIKNRYHNRSRRSTSSDRRSNSSTSSSESTSTDSTSSEDRRKRKHRRDSSKSLDRRKNRAHTSGYHDRAKERKNYRRQRSSSKDKKSSQPRKNYGGTSNQKLSETEKELRRKEMMEDAVVRDKERSRHLERHKEEEKRERQNQKFDSEFAHREFLRSTHHSSVEQRIRSKINNIQRSNADMSKNFSRR